jgi:para-nitrobenzyl esterase
VNAASPVVETRHGRLRGCAEEGALVFRGIHYARAAEGELRWRTPAGPEPWPGVRDAVKFAPPAPQRPGTLTRMLGFSAADASEDCLALNLWTPAADGARRPVLVWIHGGSFTSGAGSMPAYDGADLARREDVVVVTINYRLGALGFLAWPGANEADADANLGLLDQIAALGWVREHADRFGGDPGRITLMGESAGAMAIGSLLAVPRARGLFRRAILQSGAAANVSPPEQAERVAARFFAELGLRSGDFAAARRVPVEAVLGAQDRTLAGVWREIRGLAFQPVCDRAFREEALLPEPPLPAVAAGAARGVDLLVGTNLDENRLWSLTDPKLRELDAEALLRRVARSLGRQAAPRPDLARRVVEAYRAARAGRAGCAPSELWHAIETDRLFRWPAIRLAESQALQHPAVFQYLFTWPSPALEGALGSCHGVDIPFVFGTLRVRGVPPLVGEGPACERLSRRIQAAWAAFARAGDPSHPDPGTWPPYDARRRATQVLGAECSVADAPGDTERALWAGIAGELD